MATKNPAVLWTVQQSLQNEDKARARSNIGAASASDLPSYTSNDADKSLCVNDVGNATEWARRLRGRFVEDDGQGGVNSYDVRTLTVNMNDSSKGLVRMWPEGKNVQTCGWLVPEFHAYTDGGKVLALDSDANHLVWTSMSTDDYITPVHEVSWTKTLVIRDDSQGIPNYIDYPLLPSSICDGRLGLHIDVIANLYWETDGYYPNGNSIFVDLRRGGSTVATIGHIGWPKEPGGYVEPFPNTQNYLRFSMTAKSPANKMHDDWVLRFRGAVNGTDYPPRAVQGNASTFDGFMFA